MRRAAVIGAGSWGTAVAVLLARGGLEVQLGTRTAKQAAEIDEAAREPRATCRACRCPSSLACARPQRSSSPASTSSAWRSPPSSLPQAVGAIADRVGVALLGAAADQGPDRAARPAAGRIRRRAGAGPRDRLSRRARPTPARPSPARPPWCSARPTPTCATSSARSSTGPASSASAPATSSGSRWRARRRTPPRWPPPPPSRTG